MRQLFWVSLLLLVGCDDPKSQAIAKIPEASGIDFCQKEKNFVVANDEGTYYMMDKKGKILSQEKLGKYDLEGVVCEDEVFIFALEDQGLLIVDRKTHSKKVIPIEPLYKGKKLALFEKKSGIEGIAKVGNTIYIAKQSKKSESSFIAIVALEPSAKIVGVIEHHLKDTAGLTYHDNALFMVSDKEDLIIKYDIAKEKIVKKMKLEKGAWEGIAFDNKENLYLADDEGRVVKYKKKALDF